MKLILFIGICLFGTINADNGVAKSCVSNDCKVVQTNFHRMLGVGGPGNARYDIEIISEYGADEGGLPGVRCHVKGYPDANAEPKEYACEARDVEYHNNKVFRSKNGFDCSVPWADGSWDKPSIYCQTDSHKDVKLAWTINKN